MLRGSENAKPRMPKCPISKHSTFFLKHFFARKTHFFSTYSEYNPFTNPDTLHRNISCPLSNPARKIQAYLWAKAYVLNL